jgi:hypothetical protein
MLSKSWPKSIRFSKTRKTRKNLKMMWTLLISLLLQEVTYLFLTYIERGGSGRTSLKSPNRKSINEGEVKSASSIYTGAVDASVSGTQRNRRVSQRVLERIQNDPRAGRFIENPPDK